MTTQDTARTYRRQALVVAGVVLAVAAVVTYALVSFGPRASTPTQLVDRYVSARQNGDAGAMADILGGNDTLREGRLREVAGRPVSVTQVTLTRSPDFDFLYTLSVRVSDGGKVSVDHLLVLPQQGLDPAKDVEWEVSVTSD